jgi:hypothetical protein
MMIPMGRSLQRLASAPDFFRYPRFVVGVDGWPQQGANGTGMFLRNRLYVGYNEKVSLLEVISYNESAGRFEYQVVHDYGPGLTPKVSYANRSVCLSCHQNQTPIFSDPDWKETNANAAIAQLLAGKLGQLAGADGSTYQGVPILLKDLSVPQAVDNAVLAADMIPSVHFLWQKLCAAGKVEATVAAKCREQVLALVLKMGLSNQLLETSPIFRDPASLDAIDMITKNWLQSWSGGILIADPRIPNRNPLVKNKFGTSLSGRASDATIQAEANAILNNSNITVAEEPLSRRAPLDQWMATNEDHSGLASWLSQMTYFFSKTDWDRIDKWISVLAKKDSQIHEYQAKCSVIGAGTSFSISCGSTQPVRLTGSVSWPKNTTFGFLDSVSLCEDASNATFCPTAEHLYIVETGATNSNSDSNENSSSSASSSIDFTAVNSITHLRSRLSNGNLILKLKITLNSQTEATVTVTELRDFSYLEKALAQGLEQTIAGRSTLFAKAPFNRTLILTSLRSTLTGVDSDPRDCCLDTQGMPPAREDDIVSNESDANQLESVFGKAAPFIKNCALCHRNSTGFPPNYLFGSPAEIQEKMRKCAPRIYYRLYAWDIAPEKRGKSPMPPLNRLKEMGLSEKDWVANPALAQLRKSINDILAESHQTAPDVQTVDYGKLPACDFHF